MKPEEAWRSLINCFYVIVHDLLITAINIHVSPGQSNPNHWVLLHSMCQKTTEHLPGALSTSAAINWQKVPLGQANWSSRCLQSMWGCNSGKAKQANPFLCSLCSITSSNRQLWRGSGYILTPTIPLPSFQRSKAANAESETILRYWMVFFTQIWATIMTSVRLHSCCYVCLKKKKKKQTLALQSILDLSSVA